MCVRVYVEYASRAHDIRTQLHQAACALISEIRIHSLLFPLSRDAYDEKSTGFYFILQNVYPDADCCYLRDIPPRFLSHLFTILSFNTLLSAPWGKPSSYYLWVSVLLLYDI